MAVYDDEKTNTEDLYKTTGIDKDEMRDMEARAHAGADQDRGTSPEDLENNAYGSDFRNNMSDRVGQGFQYAKEQGVKHGKSYLGGKLASKAVKRAALPSILSGLAVVAVIMFFVLQGPAQLAYFAQVLQKYHFTASQAFLAHRGALLIKFARTADTPQNRNLSYFGNTIADHYEKRLKAKGIELEYDKRRVQRIRINPNTPEGRSAIGSLKKQGVNVDSYMQNGGRSIVVPVDGSAGGAGNAQFRRHAISGMVDTLELGVINDAMAKRILKKRGLVNLHPLKNKARAWDESLRKYYDARKEERAKYISDGTDNTVKKGKAGQTTDEDGNSSTSPDDERYASEGNEISEEGGDPKTPIEERTSKLKAKLTSGVGAVGYLTIVCAVKGLGDGVGNIRQQNIVEPLKRTGMYPVSADAQMRAGIDTNDDEVGSYIEDMYDEKTKTSVFSARSIQAEEGEKLTGPDMPDAAKPGKNKPTFFTVVDDTVGLIPGGSTFCGAVNSTAGGWILTGASVALLATGPISAAANSASAGFQYLILDTFMEDILRWIAGQQVDANPTGAQLGNYANYGARLAANETSISYGGVELSEDESLALKSERLKKEDLFFKNSSFFARYLDINSANSLIAKTIFENNLLHTQASDIASILQIPVSLLSKLGSAITFGQVGAAGTSYDYGFPEYGFSLDEIDDERFQDPYENARIVEPQLAELNEKYGKLCFNTTVDPVTFALNQEADSKKYEEIPNYCKDRSNELLTRYRFYLADMTNANCMALFEGLDTEGCVNAQSSGGTASNDTPSGELVSGEDRDIAKQILDSGKVTGDSRYISQIEAYANGNNDCHINSTVLRLILTIAQNHSIYITSLNRLCTGVLTDSGTSSYHYREKGGHAFDIGTVDGVSSTGATENDVKLLKEILPLLPSGSGIGQDTCGRSGLSLPSGVTEFYDTCNHVHIQVPVD